MGYDIHITRQENWYDEDELKQISLQEWEAYVSNDPEMRLDHFAEALLPDQSRIRIEQAGIAVWTAYPGKKTHSNLAWFAYSGGNITVKNPDAAIMKKMLQIATKLQARMQGDEGELYDSSEIAAVAKMLKAVNKKSSRPWWKLW